jgi:hypothetical protein
MKTKIFLLVQTSKKHSPWFLSEQEILQLSAVQLKENVELYFVALELIPHTICFVGNEAGGLQQSY